MSTVEDGGSTVTTTFTLIKSILSRQHNCPELKDLMNHVAKASITCERDAVRTQARQTFYQYLMDYPIGKALNGHVQFYLSQLAYEVQNGRESAFEMITLLIKTLPPVSEESFLRGFFLNKFCFLCWILFLHILGNT